MFANLQRFANLEERSVEMPVLEIIITIKQIRYRIRMLSPIIFGTLSKFP